MAVATLVATVGSATANSYATVAEATQYQDNRPDNFGTTWSAATANEKTEAMLWATVLMEALIEWNGWRVDAVQALQWPRRGMLDRNDNLIADTVIPQELKNAQAEFARQLIANDLMADSDIEKKKLTRLTAGPVTLEFGAGVTASQVPDAVFLLLPQDWIASVHGRGTGTRSLMRA